MLGFDESYCGKLRNAVGDMEIIVPSARAVLIDEQNRVLLIKRKDNSEWGIPAGSIEMGESIYQCMVREVLEETGLTVTAASPVAIYTEPHYSFENAHGRRHCTFALSFRVEKWNGDLLRKTDETIDAKFFERTQMPKLVYHYDDVISDAFDYSGTFTVK